MLAQSDPAEINTRLLSLGGSQMDMYTGSLTPEAIFDEIRGQLKLAGVNTRTDYEALLAKNDGYTETEVVLSDASVWILRLAEDKAHYIHLHPGRYSPYTFRVKASALKTALAYQAATQYHLLTKDLLADLNRVRKELRLSPLRSISESGHILEVIALLKQD
ncbi:hypothetical protein [Chitinophaga polysaccharea]|uniref:hypothetical protein n=1 Tax=Chitinophaga polysaccharea TaxID=1293035 RepID=UPI0011575188|nr:hypothetical protein [Chitinophaga polysaccharea]